MKRWATTVLVLWTGASARADLHVERSMVNGVAGDGNPPIVMLESYRAHWQRIDSPARERGIAPDRYSLYDDSKGESILFSPGSFVRLPNAELASQAEKTRQQIEKFVKEGGSVPGFAERGAFPKFALVEKTKRNGIPCALYQVSNGKKTLGTLCAASATDLNLGDADFELLRRSLNYGGSSAGFSIGADWISETRYGFPVSIAALNEDDGSSYVSEVVSLRSVALPDSYFAIPEGLTEKAANAAMDEAVAPPAVAPPQPPSPSGDNGGNGRVF